MNRHIGRCAPFTYAQDSLTVKNGIVLSLLCFQMLLFFAAKDFSALLNVVLCIGAVILVSFLASLVNKQKNWFGLNLITEGMLIGFCVPTAYEPIALFFLVSLSYFFIKVLFSGNGGNIFSCPAFTVLVLYFSFPEFFPQNLNDIDLIKANGNMLSTLQVKGLLHNDKKITSLLNYFFANIGVAIPEGYACQLLNSVSTVPAFRYNLLTLFSSAVLFACRISERIIFVVSCLVYGILVFCFAMYPIDGQFFSGDILSALCTTGFFFYASFVLQESSTTPNSAAGKIIFGIVFGTLAFFICGTGGNAFGIAAALLAANCLSPLICWGEEKFLIRNIRKTYARKN